MTELQTALLHTHGLQAPTAWRLLSAAAPPCAALASASAFGPTPACASPWLAPLLTWASLQPGLVLHGAALGRPAIPGQVRVGLGSARFTATLQQAAGCGALTCSFCRSRASSSSRVGAGPEHHNQQHVSWLAQVVLHWNGVKASPEDRWMTPRPREPGPGPASPSLSLEASPLSNCCL
jgi:hypothetical protein